MNTDKGTKTMLLILASMVLGGLLGVVAVNGMISNPVKTEETASSSSSSSSSETSSSTKKDTGSTATTIEVKSDDGTSTVQKNSEKQKNVNAKSDDMYTPDGVLRYATTNPDMLAIRKVLLERWEYYTGQDTSDDMVRLHEITGGFGVSAGGVSWGSIMDEGNGVFSFQIKDGSGNEPGYKQPYVTKGKETIS